MDPTIVRAAAEAFLTLHGGTAHRVVLMDENILGGTDRRLLLRPNRFYPWAHHRLARLTEMFPDHDIEIGIGLRNPADFLPSCWSENLHHSDIAFFETYMDGITPEKLHWSELATRIRESFPKARLFLWTYEDYFKAARRLYRRITNDPAAELIAPIDKVMRPGISSKAVELLFSRPRPSRDRPGAHRLH